jgi:preprotein translocase subunit SecG
MMVSPVLAVSFFMNLVAIVFVICAVVLMLVVLIQKGKGGGLSAAFGGGMASGILGSKTGDFLTWVTIAMVSVFLAIAVVMAKFYRPGISDFGEGQPQPTQQMPAQQLPAQQPPVQQLPAQQPPVRQQQPAPASPDASRGGGPQSSEPPLAPAQTGGESTEANSLGG